MTGPRRLILPDSGAVRHGDGRVSAPSAERNAGPILDLLRRHAPETGTALEIASGTGQHIAAFAAALPGIDWTPTEADPARFASIEAWRAASRSPNLHPPRPLDATALPWPEELRGVDLIVLVNLLHLISEAEAENILTGVATALAPGGSFLLYGPFRRDGLLTSDGDAGFDARLKAQDPAIGYKDDGWVRDRAGAAGLHLRKVAEMPANNLAFLFRVVG
jgi:SAM-dependent methyltransferase